MLRIRKVPLWETATTINATAAISVTVDVSRYIGDAMAMNVSLAGSSVSVDLSMGVGSHPLSSDVASMTPYDSAGNDISEITSTLTASRWIQFSPVLSPYLTFTITGDGANGADTTAIAYLYLQEDV